MALAVGWSWATPIQVNNLNKNIELILELANRWLLQLAGVRPHPFR